MLSPGQFHLQVPKDREANLRFRLNILRIARRGPRHREALRRMCAQDILFYVNVFVWQHNPRKKGSGWDAEIGPFVSWDFQDDAIRTILDHVEQDDDLLIEKSREMGASWLCLIIMDWLCRFHGWKKFLCISHSEDAVDRVEDPDSLFWKVDFMHRHLPDWLRGDVRRRKLGFAYDTNSALNGAASTGRSGVGGRATAVFLDEFSKQREDAEILGQTADTGCRIFNGTHYGVGTEFYKLTKRPDLHKLVMHWSMHPEKRRGLYHWCPLKQRVEVVDKTYEFPPDYHFVTDGTPKGGPFPGLRSPWYDAQVKRRANSRDVAMHLDIDPEGSVSQFFDPLMIDALVTEFAVAPYWQGDIRRDPDTGRPLGLDPSPGGPLKLWMRPRADGSVPPAPYAAGCDIAVGTGATPSCLSVLNCRTGEKVGEYTNAHIDPKDFGLVATALCWLFTDEGGQPARLIWEQQGPGLSFASKVLEVGFRNIYYRTAEMPHSMKLEVSERPGWVPTPDTKRVLLENYRSALNLRKFVNRSEAALKECLKFRYTSRGDVEHGQMEASDPTAARVNHGDHVIADALVCKLAEGTRAVVKEEEARQPAVGTLDWRRQLHAQGAAAAAW